jgi:hypothetical protein
MSPSIPAGGGSRGITRLPGQEPLHWLLREVSPPEVATIAIALAGAVLSFQWKFDGLPDGPNPNHSTSCAAG